MSEITEYSKLANQYVQMPPNEQSANIWEKMYYIHQNLQKEFTQNNQKIMDLDDIEEIRILKTSKSYGNSWKNLWQIRINELLNFTKLLDFSSIDNNDSIKPKTIVELGSWQGNSTEAWCKYVGDGGKVYSIDNFHNPKFRLGVESKYSNLEFILSDSSSASGRFPDNSIDMIYIDCDHTYDGVAKDITHWFSKVKVGGYVCGHDFLVVSNADTKSSERKDYWTEYSTKPDAKIIEKMGIKFVGKNMVAKAIIDTLGVPDWWDTQNPPNTVGSNWFFKKTVDLNLQQAPLSSESSKTSKSNYVELNFSC
jgi:hypothetical protein